MMQKKYIVLLAFFLVVYIALSYATPLDAASLAKYHITTFEARLIGVSLTIPLVAIWFLAFFGFSKLKEYASYINNDSDGKSLDVLANGLMVLAIGLPVVSISSEIVSYLSSVRLDLVPKAVIINNYIGIAISLSAFILIFNGALGLAKITKKRFSELGTPVFALPFALLSGFYIYFALKSSVKSLAATTTTHGTYYLPDWLIVATILAPLVLIWYLGLRSASFITFYQRDVPGTIYKQALNLLSLGVIAVVLSSIIEQLLTLFSSHLTNLSTTAILIIIYLLIAVIGAGYLLIALSTSKLKKIEES
ncbi:MAG TPA: hypothetical protein VLG13_02115 [Patescibacteria group bacterium]|nr:hypothetical protein [Patescibacteria group bacterium]